MHEMWQGSQSSYREGTERKALQRWQSEITCLSTVCEPGKTESRWKVRMRTSTYTSFTQNAKLLIYRGVLNGRSKQTRMSDSLDESTSTTQEAFKWSKSIPFTTARFGASETRQANACTDRDRTNNALTVPVLPFYGPASNGSQPFSLHLNSKNKMLVLAIMYQSSWRASK